MSNKLNAVFVIWDYVPVFYFDVRKYSIQQFSLFPVSREDAVDSAFGASVILVNDIEDEIGLVDKSEKHNPLLALQTVASSTFSLTSQLKGKVESIYA